MPANTYKMPFDIDEEYGEHPVRKESFLLDNEEKRFPGSDLSRVRLLTDFVFVKEGKVVYPLYENCTDEFWQGVQVWGFMMSPGGSGRWFAWSLLWHLEWPGKHMELVRIDHVLGMSKERDTHYRNGNEIALWITTREKNTYALMEPGDAAAPGWMAVIKSWKNVGLKGLTLPRVVDPRHGVPYWWNRDGQAVGTRAWQALMKQWTALQEFEAATPPPPKKQSSGEGGAGAKAKVSASSHKSQARVEREESDEERVEASSSAKPSGKGKLPANPPAPRKPTAKPNSPRKPAARTAQDSDLAQRTSKPLPAVRHPPSEAPGPSAPRKRLAAALDSSSEELPGTSTATASPIPPAKRRVLTVKELTSPQRPPADAPISENLRPDAPSAPEPPPIIVVPPPSSRPQSPALPPAASPAPTLEADRADSPFQEEFRVEAGASMDVSHIPEWPAPDTASAEPPTLSGSGAGKAGDNESLGDTTSGMERTEVSGLPNPARASTPYAVSAWVPARRTSPTKAARSMSLPPPPPSGPAANAPSSSLSPVPPEGSARSALPPLLESSASVVAPPPAHVVLPVSPSAGPASTSLETRGSRRRRLGRST